MNLQIKRKDAMLLLLLLIILSIISIFAWRVFGTVVLVFLPILSLVILLGVFFEVHRRQAGIRREAQKKDSNLKKQEFRQIESLISLYFTLNPSVPLPHTRGWAASPDLLKKLSEEILSKKPQLIVEASSGVSTLVAAYCLKKIGAGKVISLEHDAKYASITRNSIKLHDLQDIATVLDAPLKKYDIKGEQFTWYDLVYFDVDQPIDILFVDGPPGGVQSLSRYPAVPLLYDYLDRKATIIVDDGKRKDETEMVRRWKEQFKTLDSEYIERMEKGAYVVRNDA